MGVPEEIRFAVVLNGGVSLAVWMGGVVREIDRVTKPKGPYRRLLELLDVTARADVIAGTSAGGINGAALALSQANEKADVAVMRDVWSEQGGWIHCCSGRSRDRRRRCCGVTTTSYPSCTRQ
jgi:predicted acylesterase/phospholipase RssA